MHINFTAEQLADPAIASSAVELNACLQCNYCLDNCPTHQLLGGEFDNPRGRIFLIREMLESAHGPSKKTVGHIDRCLSCMVCRSTCPSSVNYMLLVDHAREYIEQNYRRPLFDRGLRWLLAWLLPFPDRFRRAMRWARLVKPLALALPWVMPRKIRGMIELVPDTLPPPSRNDHPQVFPAEGKAKRRVALLTGCAQKALNTDINDATIRILNRHGCDVVIADGTGCCGALTYHMGKSTDSRDAAARNIRAWMKEVNGEGLDAIVINTSGCGTVVKDYDHIFRDDALAEDAETISELAKDVTEVLAELNLKHTDTPKLRISYHASCSLQHGQKLRFLPKKLLKAAGFTVLEPKDQHWCCGSAATYHVLQPEISDQLKERKVQNLVRGKPDAIAAGNIGCMVQIASGTGVPVVHTVELLDWSTGGPAPRALEDATKTAEAAE